MHLLTKARIAMPFDPYHTWLGIPPEEQPADHYRLLGLRRFESNVEAIANAMDQRMQGQIIQRLGELNREGTGMLICTHRQSLAAMADRLIVMDQGRAVLDGRSSEVLDKLRAMGAAQGQAQTQGQV